MQLSIPSANHAQYCLSKLQCLWNKESHMLWTIFVVLVVLWLLGFSLHVAGGLIHLLLVVALVVLVFNLLSGRRSAI
jgi:diacylglycerol kinase